MSYLHPAAQAERDQVVAYLQAHAGQVRALGARNRIPAGEADMLARRLDAAAEAIAEGLHADDAGAAA